MELQKQFDLQFQELELVGWTGGHPVALCVVYGDSRV